MSTFLPAVFGENMMDLFDDFDRDFFRGFGRPERALYGKNAARMMKTDVKETDEGYELAVDLPGMKKDEIHLDLSGGHYNVLRDLLGDGMHLGVVHRIFGKNTGEVVNNVLLGDVYCVGKFDPCFGEEDMRAFVESIRQLNVDTIRGHIYADKSAKDMNLLGEGWCWDDDNPVLSPLLYQRRDHFLDVFMEQLHQQGIVIDVFSGTNQCPGNALLLCRRIHTMDEVLLQMMKESDNLYAESMFYQLDMIAGDHPATAKGAAEVVKSLITRLGQNANTFSIADGSGLSLYNYLTAELEVLALRYAARNEWIDIHFRPSLPIAGVDGTLKSRMLDTSAKGNVQAKTGSVTGVSSLAGYCKASNGHRLCFSIINQGVRNMKAGRAFQDKVCEILCAKTK